MDVPDCYVEEAMKQHKGLQQQFESLEKELQG